MLTLLRHRSVRIGLAVAALLLAITTFSIRFWPEPEAPLPAVAEEWDPNLARVQTLDDAMPVVREYISKQVGTRDERIANGIDQFVRDRFIHGFSFTSVQDDWLLNLVELAARRNLTVPVIPDDILKHRHAMCSQQAIVFRALLRRFGMEYGAVMFGWPDPDPYNRGHFAVAAKVNGEWRYFDPNLEASQSPRVSEIINGTAFPAVYAERPDLVKKMVWAAAHHRIKLGHVNRFSAPRGRVMQATTSTLSALAPIILAVVGLWLLLLPNLKSRTARDTRPPS
jgi:hypothetical protein